MPQCVVDSVQNIDRLGKQQYQEFVQERLIKTPSSFNDTMKKNMLPLFKTSHAKTQAKSTKTSQLQNEVQLFSRLYIASQSRAGDMDIFFSHENQAWPPSLAKKNHHEQNIKS